MKTRTKVLLIALSIITALVLFAASSLRAGTNNNASGSMWSSNIGWISLNNCTDSVNASTCTGPDYGVTIDLATGAVSGTAWSSNIGWITFSSAGCPTGGCTAGAFVDLAYPGPDGSFGLKGWARACSVFASGCSGALSTNAGGWDGFLSLSGSGYGVILGPDSSGTRTLGGSLWGSEVIGWTSVAGVVSNVICPAGTTWSQGAPSVDPSFQCRTSIPAITASCPAPGNQITITLAPVSGADWYSYRINNLANGWEDGSGPCNNPGDSCWEGATTTHTAPGIPGANYGAWAHSRSPSSYPFFSDAMSTSFTCAPPQTDMCLDIAGVQEVVPYGRTRNAQGNCPPTETDVCTPLPEGVQTEIPAGYTRIADGSCVKTEIKIGVCLDGTPIPPSGKCPGIIIDSFCPDGSPLPPGGLKDCPDKGVGGKKVIITRTDGPATCTLTWGMSTRTVTLIRASGSAVWGIMSTIIVPPTVTQLKVRCESDPEIIIEIIKKKPIFIEF